MPYIDIASAFFGALITFVSVLSQAHFWQRKEYRIDRMRSFIISPEGSIESQPWFLAATTLVGIGWIAFLFATLSIAQIIGFASLILYFIHHSQRIRVSGMFRPEKTLKVVLVVIVTAFIIATYYSLFFIGRIASLEWSTIIFFTPICVAISVQVVNILTGFRKKQTINQAKELRQQQRDTTVVGITGSYGKTSTKYFLQQLLQNTDRNVIATKEHRNSDFTVAQDVLEQIDKNADIYVAEMGAYRIGEIKAITDIVQPSIGILTGIGQQHIDLFGSQENIIKAKWELIEALPKDGTAILNADNEFIQEAAKNIDKKIVWYSTTQHANIYAENISVKPEKVTCTLHVGDSAKEVSIPLASTGLLSSLLAAVSAAHTLGIEAQQIFTRIQHIKPYERTMEVVRGKNNALVIDDSYSGSRASVKNALEHLARFTSSDKRIVIVPLIELGEQAQASHEYIGGALAESGAQIFIYGAAYKKSIERGLRGYEKVQWYTNADQLRAAASKRLSNKSVTLLEGRIPSIVRESIVASNS